MIVGTGPYQIGISDLQTLLSDGQTDKYQYQQRCFGFTNGVNVAFKTFFRRRVTNFTVAGSGGVYKNSILIPASGVAADNVETGEFVLTTAPVDGDVIEASYFNQWFDVNELDSFLQVASGWISSSNDYTQTPYGLVNALLKYAAAEAYLKLSQRWRTYMSQEYKVEDSPKDSPTYNTDSFMAMSKTFRAEAKEAVVEFYQTRQGRALAPNFGRITGRIRNMP